MNQPESWDKIYETIPPRETREHKENVIKQLNEFLPENMEWKYVLDYWCGSGHLWEYIMGKWAYVDFAEISSTMVDLLMKKYSYSDEKTLDWKESFWQTKVFKVESPSDIPVENWTYDYIIAWSVLHHINPDSWKKFLDWFSELLKSGGKMIITWWDESDVVLKQDWFKWRVTWQPTYTINELPKFLYKEKCEIEKTWVYSEQLLAFEIPRMFRYFVIKKKN